MIPEKFLARMREWLGEEASAFEASLSRPLHKGLRVNRVKAGESWNPPFPEIQPVPWAKDGFYVDAGTRAGSCLLHTAGAYYMQEPSAMSVAQTLDPKPGEQVLDLCAAPGGKTTHAASLMGDSGLIVANEIVPSRARVLAENVRRLGLTHTIVACEHPAKIAEKFSAYFDAAIVDAPCSGEGMFKKSDSAGADWSEETVAVCAQRQAKILDSAAGCVRGGGRIVYSTCTFSKEENEETVAAFLQRHPEFRLLPVGPNFSPGFAVPGAETTLCGRIFPHRAEGEGHFLALMVKESCDAPAVRDRRPSCDREAATLYARFCKDNAVKPTGLSLERWGDRLFGVPPSPDLAGIRVLSPGLELGYIKRGRFEPSQAYASALKEGECRRTELTTEEAECYCRGETLDAHHEEGWRVACYEGFSLGWQKCSDGTAKNRFDKSLRTR